MVVCKLQERTAVEVSRTRINFLLTNIKKTKEEDKNKRLQKTYDVRK